MQTRRNIELVTMEKLSRKTTVETRVCGAILAPIYANKGFIKPKAILTLLIKPFKLLKRAYKGLIGFYIIYFYISTMVNKYSTC